MQARVRRILAASTAAREQPASGAACCCCWQSTLARAQQRLRKSVQLLTSRARDGALRRHPRSVLFFLIPCVHSVFQHPKIMCIDKAFGSCGHHTPSGAGASGSSAGRGAVTAALAPSPYIETYSTAPIYRRTLSEAQQPCALSGMLAATALATADVERKELLPALPTCSSGLTDRFETTPLTYMGSISGFTFTTHAADIVANNTCHSSTACS